MRIKKALVWLSLLMMLNLSLSPALLTGLFQLLRQGVCLATTRSVYKKQKLTMVTVMWENFSSLVEYTGSFTPIMAVDTTHCVFPSPNSIEEMM